MHQLKQNVRVGIRGLRRSPFFAVAAILSLALGVGLATAVFTVADALLLRRLPVTDQDRLVVVAGEKRDGTFPNYPLDLAAAREFATNSRALRGVALFGYEGAWPKPIRTGDQVTRMRRALVSGEFFDVLGVTAELGRGLHPSDDATGAAPVIVLSHGAWQQRFGGDRNVLGRRVSTYDDGITYTIVGVMPKGFDFPRGAELWASILPSVPQKNLQFVSVNVIGRLASGSQPLAAQEEMTAFFARATASAWERSFRGTVQTFPRLVLGDVKPALLTFVAACALLLVITSMNIANLLFVRGLGRVQEIAVRSALGAGRGTIILGLLVENALLAVLGGAFGLAFAAAAVRAFVALAPADLPRVDEIRLNGPALLAALGVTAVATLLSALAPAVLTARTDLQRVLRSGARQSPGGAYRRATEGVVICQVALAVLVLSAAGLMARSLVKLESTDLSFNPSHLLIAELSVRLDQFTDAPKQAALLERLLNPIRAIPGVRDVSPTVAPPFAGSGGWDIALSGEGESPEDAKTAPMLSMEIVAPSYFATLGIPMLAGRSFTDDDRADMPAVAVISQSTARHYWPTTDPIGKRLVFAGKPRRTVTVVGVVADTRYRDLRAARPSIYLPLRQSFFPFAPMTLVVRTDRAPEAVVSSLRRVIGDVDPGVALASAAPFATFMDRSLAQSRLNTLLLAVFAGVAVILAAVGLFGVIATMVRQRTRELSVRVALGATSSDLVRMVTLRGLALTAVGVLAGTVVSVFANRALVAMLYDVSPTDPVTLALVAGVLLSVAALASFLPARASGRIDGSVALRAEG